MLQQAILTSNKKKWAQKFGIIGLLFKLVSRINQCTWYYQTENKLIGLDYIFACKERISFAIELCIFTSLFTRWNCPSWRWVPRQWMKILYFDFQQKRWLFYTISIYTSTRCRQMKYLKIFERKIINQPTVRMQIFCQLPIYLY